MTLTLTLAINLNHNHNQNQNQNQNPNYIDELLEIIGFNGSNHAVTPKNIKKAYIAKAKVTHSDKNPSVPVVNMQNLNNAYAQLKEIYNFSGGSRKIRRKSKKGRKSKKDFNKGVHR